MDLNTLLSTVVLVSFIVTIILAVGSYLAFKGREVRRPDPETAIRSGEPVYFERIYLHPKRLEEEAHALPSRTPALRAYWKFVLALARGQVFGTFLLDVTGLARGTGDREESA